jgi:hypothetical protein
MNWFKKIYSILFVLLLLEIHPVSQGNNHNIFLPINDNTDGKEVSSELTNKDISDKMEKRLFFSPIRYQIIKSSRTPRLPPVI